MRGSFSFKKNLGLVSLAVMASFMCSFPTYAMEAGREEGEKAAIEISRDIQSFDHVNRLIVSAIQGNREAQYNLGLMYEYNHGGNQDKKEAIRFYTLAANQGHEKAQFHLLKKYETGKGTERNLIEALRWTLKLRNGDVKIGTFFNEAFPNPVASDDFQKLLVDIIDGTPSAEDGENSGLSLVLGRHQLKMLMNKSGGFVDQAIAIPDLGEMYKPIVEFEEEVMRMVGDLQKAKPGFLTSLSLTDECKKFLPRQREPLFFSEDILDGRPENSPEIFMHRVTWGEENVPLVKKFLKFYQEISANFTKVDKELIEIATLYKNGQDKALSDLMVAQCGVQQHSDDPKFLATFNKRKKTYEDIKSCVAIPLQEIEEERALLQVTLEKIKSLPKRGLGSRNADALKEYPILEGLF